MRGPLPSRCCAGASQLSLLLPVMLGRMIFEFEDSEVAEDTGRSGAGEGLWQPLLLIFKQVAHVNKAPEPHLTEILTAIGRVHRAELLLDGLPAGQRLRSLPMPFESDAVFALELEFASGPFCELRGKGLELRSLLSQCSVDSYQC